MSLPELFLLAVGLSMDAFAVSVCKGLSLSRVEIKHMFLAGLYFGGFQAGMPALGYLLGLQFQDAIVAVDHWIAFFLLGFIGLDMVKDAVGGKEEALDNSFAAKTMVALAVATSIDALAVGITFAFLQVRLLHAVSFIGMITFALSMAGLCFWQPLPSSGAACRGRNLNAYGGENPLRTSSGTWKDAYCEPMNSNEVWVRTAFYRFVSCKGKGLCVMMIHIMEKGIR